ncbi:alpha/beta hydrolase [Pseudonocardia sp. TRM90224]|uniref:alpha/beta hydrolase n=1 Tax=Pseudonocardia sp. TRM90224 TaxID=2812678 RepID=UPI001E65129B|nr:alpha/beta hydrolase fold domain-containing protein [Pseudonocardia sp. TRM90224]
MANNPAHHTAQLALRGSAGRLWSDLHRPAEGSGALLVYLSDPAGPLVEPAALGTHAGLMVLVSRPTTPHDAIDVVEWAAEHAAELDADPDRLLVGGEHRGAAFTAAVARQARDDGWPDLLRQVLVAPPPATEACGGTAPATVVGDPGYAQRLRQAGVAVEEVAGGTDLPVRLGAALRLHAAR